MNNPGTFLFFILTVVVLATMYSYWEDRRGSK